MIKFFRKIRHKLLSENKFSKYLIYAIGEIVLVVIGILIAFGINSWWSEVQRREMEVVMLHGFQKDFLVNADLLDNIKEQHRKALVASDVLAELVGPRVELTVTHDSISSLLQSLRNNWSFDPVTGTLKSLLNSGDISLIQNWELRTSLVSWLDNVEDLNEDEMIQRNEIQQRLTPFLVEHIPLRQIIRANQQDVHIDSFSTDYVYLLRDRTFQNLIEVRRSFAINILGELDVVERECDKILRLTKENLKKY